jgi:hypothetical protein
VYSAVALRMISTKQRTIALSPIAIAAVASPDESRFGSMIFGFGITVTKRRFQQFV